MHKVSFAEMRCSLGRSLDIVGEWWTMLILRDIWLGVCRFDEIATDLGVSRNLLTTRLDKLRASGLIEQRSVSGGLRQEYALTESGAELVPILIALTEWGDRWASPPEGPPIRFVHMPCGHQLASRFSCAACDVDITADNVLARPGPGGAATPGTRIVARKLAAKAI